MKPLFEILHRDRSSKARTGRLFLPHGSVETPVFMPVGTAGTVKAMNHGELERIGWRLMLSNTYHLYLRPGAEVISAYGSLHDFNSWRHNILTDSGGFQVFSLAPFRKVRREGVRFRSHIDGSYHTLTPESVVDFQTVLNSDIQMVLDVCSEKGISEKKAKEAAYITAEWARRAKSRWLQKKEEGYEGELFGIVQGNFYKDLRKMSAEITNEIDFPGVAIGGLSVGEEKNEFGDFLAYTAALLPDGKPRYVMGIGTPDYLFEAVENGIDMFDCVLPTRVARNGTAATDDGWISLKKAQYAVDRRPLSEECTCSACRNYSRGYLHHLVKAGEISASVLITEHNLTWFYRLTEQIRRSIREERFSEFKKSFLTRFSGGRV